jgi:hypothetical protein
LTTERVSRRLAGAQRRQLGGLVEVVGEGFLGDLVCFPTGGPHVELNLGRSPGGMEEGGRGRLTDVGEDLGDGVGVGKECNERERRLTGGADEGKDFKDPSQEGGPSGGARGACVRWLAWGFLWTGRRGRRSQGKFGIGVREVSGEGIVLPGPGRDQRSQRSVGGEDPMVPVAMDAGWGEDRGEAIQEPERIRATRRVSL